MPVFDGANKTRTRIDLAGDKFTPGMGSLVGSGEKEEIKVHGTRKLTIDGNEDRTNKANLVHKVKGDHSLTVSQKQNVKVLGDYRFFCLSNGDITFVGNKIETDMSNLTVTIYGVETKTQLGGNNNTDIGPWSLVAQGFKNLLNPSSWMEVKTNSGTLVTSMNVSMGAINLAGFIQNTEAYAQQINILGHDTLIKGIDTEAKMLKQRLAGMVNAIDGLEGSVQGLKTQAGAVEGKVKACEAGIIKLATQSTVL
jgi:hypothetical protein